MSAPFEAERLSLTTRRRQMYKAETRAALLSAAEELFVARGFAGTSIGAITETALVSKGTFYNHFADKTAIFAEIYTKQVERIGSMTQETCVAIESHEASARSAAGELIDRLLRYGAGNRGYQAVITAAPAVLADGFHQINVDVVLPHFRRLLLMLQTGRGESPAAYIDAAGHVLLSALVESVRVIRASCHVESDIQSYARTLEAVLYEASRADG